MTSGDTHVRQRSPSAPPPDLALSLDAAADSILDAFRWGLLPVQHSADLVVLAPAWCLCAHASLDAGRPSGWGPSMVVPLTHRRFALACLGIPPHEHAELLGEDPKPGYVHAVVVVSGYVVPRQIKLRYLQRGGAA